MKYILNEIRRKVSDNFIPEKTDKELYETTIEETPSESEDAGIEETPGKNEEDAGMVPEE